MYADRIGKECSTPALVLRQDDPGRSKTGFRTSSFLCDCIVIPKRYSRFYIIFLKTQLSVLIDHCAVAAVRDRKPVLLMEFFFFLLRHEGETSVRRDPCDIIV